MRHTIRRCALLLLLLSIPPAVRSQVIRQPFPMPGQPQQPTGPAIIKVRVEGEQVTAELRNAPWQKVLEELAARTGIVFEVQMQENAPVSLSLFRVSLQEGVQRIVGNNDSIFYYGSDSAGQSRIQYVRVFPRREEPQQPSIRYIGTGSITKSGEDVIDNPDQALKILTEGKDVDARQKAIEILVASKSEATYQALLDVLGDPAPEIRVAAIEGLASLNARTALPRILHAFKDSHPGVRQSAITAVALLGDVENLKDLRPMQRDKDANVAAAAEVAIRKLSMRTP
jgi:hypothetical protein